MSKNKAKVFGYWKNPESLSETRNKSLIGKIKEPIEEMTVSKAAKKGRNLSKFSVFCDCQTEIIYATIGKNFKNPISAIPESIAQNIQSP